MKKRILKKVSGGETTWSGALVAKDLSVRDNSRKEQIVRVNEQDDITVDNLGITTKIGIGIT